MARSLVPGPVRQILDVARRDFEPRARLAPNISAVAFGKPSPHCPLRDTESSSRGGDPGTIQFPQTPQAPQDEDRRLSTLIADLPSARCQLKHLPDARSCDRPAGTQRAFSHGR